MSIPKGKVVVKLFPSMLDGSDDSRGFAYCRWAGGYGAPMCIPAASAAAALTRREICCAGDAQERLGFTRMVIGDALGRSDHRKEESQSPAV